MNKIEFFDRWAPSYDWVFPSVFYQAVHVRILDYAQLPETAIALEIGCGTGKLLNRLAQHKPTLTGVGIDLSDAMVNQARKKTPFRDRLQFIQANVTDLPFATQSFDGIFCSISFLHYPDPDRAMGEIARVLKPDGKFYLADFTPPRGISADALLRQVSPGGVRFYNAPAREALGRKVGLGCDRHVYLLGPVMLSVFRRQ